MKERHTISLRVEGDLFTRLNKCFEYEMEHAKYHLTFPAFVRRGLSMLVKDVEYEMKKAAAQNDVAKK